MRLLGWMIHRHSSLNQGIMKAKRKKDVMKEQGEQAAQSAGPPTLTSDVSPVLEVYDTTLRDGAQAEDVSFSAEDKVRVAHKLDELGVQYIEGGWPGANPKDIEFFRMMKTIPLHHATVVAFGSTRKADNPVRKDTNIHALLQADTSTITLFGKTWTLHVTDALRISLAQNLEMI